MATKNESVISIKPIETKAVIIRIVGDTPLIVHAWSEKVKKQMLDAMQGTKKGKQKESKDPVEEFIDCFYWIDGKPNEKTMDAFEEAIKNGARFGFPAVAVKEAATAAAYRNGWIKNQAGARGAFFILPDDTCDGLCEIHCQNIRMREDPVTVGIGGKDLRYRPEFVDWYMDLKVQFNKASMDFSEENIIAMINAGGFSCGIGEWRPEKDGIYGRYHVAQVD